MLINIEKASTSLPSDRIGDFNNLHLSEFSFSQKVKHRTSSAAPHSHNIAHFLIWWMMIAAATSCVYIHISMLRIHWFDDWLVMMSVCTVHALGGCSSIFSLIRSRNFCFPIPKAYANAKLRFACRLGVVVAAARVAFFVSVCRKISSPLGGVMFLTFGFDCTSPQRQVGWFWSCAFTWYCCVASRIWFGTCDFVEEMGNLVGCGSFLFLQWNHRLVTSYIIK